MTLALHGKSKQRQWLLLAAAFWAVVVGAALALSIGQSASAASGPGDFQDNQETMLPIPANDPGFLRTESCDRGPYQNQEGTVWHFVTTGSGKPIFISLTAEFGAVPVGAAIAGTGGAANKHAYVLGPSGEPLTGVSAVTDPAGAVYVLSHICGANGTDDPVASVDVTKTANTRFTRTHAWDIEKSVTTDKEYEHNELPKIWLYIDGSGDETATWTVDVSYEGSTDSKFSIYGTIIVTNTGDVPVTINSITDDLGIDGYENINLVCDIDPNGATLLPLEAINCTYDVDLNDGDALDGDSGTNTARADFSSAIGPDDYAEGTAGWKFDGPTTEVNKTVNIEDISDLLGTVDLGTVTAPDGKIFTYDKLFEWADYGADGCGDHRYDNTATIVETGQSASAALLVNVQCYVYETAFGKGANGRCFIDDGFSRWGWTNKYIVGSGTVDYELWAAAGQCDTSKGTHVGTVTVESDASGNVIVTFDLFDGFLLDETHVYVGTGKYPTVRQGKKTSTTVAPGQYTNNGPFSAEDKVYVIAHGVVGIPDPDFGP